MAGLGGDWAGVGCGVGEDCGSVFAAARGGCGADTGAGVGVARGAGDAEGSFGGSRRECWKLMGEERMRVWLVG